MPYGKPTQRVELSDGYHATVRTSVTMDEGRELAKLRREASGDADAEAANASRFMALILTEWDLDDDDGQLLPINETNVGKLLAVDFKAIMEAYTGSQTRTRGEQVDFTDISTSGPEAIEMTHPTT